MPAREGILAYPDQLLLFNGGRQAQVHTHHKSNCGHVVTYLLRPSHQARGGNVRQLAIAALNDSVAAQVNNSISANLKRQRTQNGPFSVSSFFRRFRFQDASRIVF